MLNSVVHHLSWITTSQELTRHLSTSLMAFFKAKAKEMRKTIVIDHMAFSKKGELIGFVYKLPMGDWVVHRKNRKVLRFQTEDEAFNAILDWGNKQ